ERLVERPRCTRRPREWRREPAAVYPITAEARRQYLGVEGTRLSTTSIWIFLTVGCGEPHQFGTAENSTNCFGVRALMVYGPVPTNVSGLVHQLVSSFVVTFWSTTAVTSV